MPVAMRWPCCVLVLAACGGGDGDGADGVPDVPRPACPDHVHARFYLSGGSDEAFPHGSYEDLPYLGTEVEPANGCRSYQHSNDQDPAERCDFSCGGDEICTTEGICVERPERMDIGPVRMTGVEPDVILRAYNDLVYTGEHVTYEPGDELTVSGGGGDSGVESFAITVAGVPTLTVPWTSLSARSGEDLVVTWDPAGSPPGTRMRFYAYSGGIVEERVDCWADDTGELTIPAADIAGVLTGVPTASLTRVTVATVETELGCAMFQTDSWLDVEIDPESAVVP